MWRCAGFPVVSCPAPGPLEVLLSSSSLSVSSVSSYASGKSFPHTYTPPPPILVNGTGNSPSPGRPTPGVVKQDKSSGGSVDTTKPRSDPQRVRMSSGKRPIGTAKGKQSDTEALCQPPPLSKHGLVYAWGGR